MSKDPVDEMLSAWKVTPRHADDFPRRVLENSRPSQLYRLTAVVLAMFLIGGLAGWATNSKDTQRMAQHHAQAIVEVSGQ